MTREEFSIIMAYLEAGSGTGRKATREQCEVYFDILGGLPFNVVKDAARVALSEIEYPTIPPVGAILSRARGIPAKLKASDRAIIAYGAASREVAGFGGYASVDFDDPLMNATIRQMGGWVRFCDWDPSELQWRQRDFERIYASLSVAGASGELCAHLQGIIEPEAGLWNETPQVSRIPIDLPPQPAPIRGRIPKQKRIAHEIVTRTVSRLRPAVEDEPLKVDNPKYLELTEAEFNERKSDAISRLKAISSSSV